MKKLLIFSLLVFLSCKKEKQIIKPEKNTYKDSILTIFDFHANLKPNNLSSEKAKLILNQHFKQKGFLIESELDFAKYNPEEKEYFDKKAIDFLEIKPINDSATIVKYYNCEPFENGTCVQPHYAIIANTIYGNKIIHEDFLPKNFVLDTIKRDKGKLFLLGYYFECANKKKLQSYRILIK